ncbi:MAG TPA: 50S ribosomal protein L19 [Candidatus Dojkabacteria bacterium]|nr:50S ribosomal protein L19 [Candidatus Dojkabacteria bacterium]
MNYKEIETNEKKFIKDLPEFNVGDTIAVSTIVREGDKKRTQLFKGLVIAIKGSGIRKTFTIRKISNGVGVEKIIPLNTPNISKVKVIKRGNVRKSKLYYMRNRIGKKALKVKEGVFVPATETKVEEVVDAEQEAAE